MASNQTNSISENQTIANNIMQFSKQSCAVSATTNISGNTYIFVHVTGGITFTETASIINAACNMSQVLDVEIKSIIEALAQQEASAANGFSLDFANIQQDLSIYQMIKNSVTQIMESSCTISANSTYVNNYLYAQDISGGYHFSQSATVTGATCNMSNLAKAVVYNQAASTADQKNTITSVFTLLFGGLAIAMILAVVVVGIFMISGGLTKTISAYQSGQGGGGGGGQINPQIINDALGNLNEGEGENLEGAGGEGSFAKGGGLAELAEEVPE